VTFLGYRDGYVEHTLDLRRDIAREFRRARPHRLLALDPAPVAIPPAEQVARNADHRRLWPQAAVALLQQVAQSLQSLAKLPNPSNCMVYWCID